MLEMETKLTIGLNKMVLPICLPKPGDVEENLMVLQTKALKTVELKTISNEKCQSDIIFLYRRNRVIVKGDHLCTEKDMDCRGQDVGGALFRKVDGRYVVNKLLKTFKARFLLSRYNLLGITLGCTEEMPQMYTRFMSDSIVNFVKVTLFLETQRRGEDSACYGLNQPTVKPPDPPDMVILCWKMLILSFFYVTYFSQLYLHGRRTAFVGNHWRMMSIHGMYRSMKSLITTRKYHFVSELSFRKLTC